METFHYISGSIPIIISIPHAGTYVPDTIFSRFSDSAKKLPDTDWHVAKLYDFARELDIHWLVATHSRYVIDLNRAPDDQTLYPGKFTTGLCPITQFDGTPIYHSDDLPTIQEISERKLKYWQPYHHKLQSLIKQLKSHHHKVILFDAHSICSQVPMLFEGTLPDLNLGTGDGISAEPSLMEKLIQLCQQTTYSLAYNGRFKGGYITRHYGNPQNGIQALQLELAQKNYMDEQYPYHYDDNKAQKLQNVLQGIIRALIAAV